MTDIVTEDDWDAGFAGDPRPVTAAVTGGVTGDVIPGVTPTVTGAATSSVTGAVTSDPAEGDHEGDSAGSTGAAPAGGCTEPAGGAGPGGSLAGVLARLTAVTRISPHLGGGGLGGELADPCPGTWREHWQQVTSHERLPAGPLPAIGFAAVYLLVTGPVKLTGQLMEITGRVLTETGKRLNRTGDSFLATIIVIPLAITLVFLIVTGADQLISQLP